MLVLSRKVGERILLGDQIKITVVRVTSSGVRLGIEAPSHIAVVREEVNRDDETPPAPPQTGSDASRFRRAVE
jgi:carbon storage regulator